MFINIHLLSTVANLTTVFVHHLFDIEFEGKICFGHWVQNDVLFSPSENERFYAVRVSSALLFLTSAVSRHHVANTEYSLGQCDASQLLRLKTEKRATAG